MRYWIIGIVLALFLLGSFIKAAIFWGLVIGAGYLGYKHITKNKSNNDE